MKADHSSRPGISQETSHNVVPRPQLRPQRNPAGILSRKLSRISLIAIAGLAGTASANASSDMWWDDDPVFHQRPAPAPPPRPRRVQNSYPKLPVAPKDLATPQGALVIAISLNQQHLKIYDANGLFAEAPVSSGMRGHSTPTGIFSVIQKSKWHRSNLYSDAPMPFMQRLTWSGIALHAGALPGYPASHGCIRVPVSFAVQAWSWTRMGARVVITHGEVTPTSFAHALLPTQKPAADEVPSASAKPPVAPADDTAARTGDSVTPASLQLRPGLVDGQIIIPANTTAASLRARTYIADAGRAMPDLSSSAITSDAPASHLRVATLAADTNGSSDELMTGSVLKKDTVAAPPTAETPATSKSPAAEPALTRQVIAKPAGRIAVYISAKDSRLYVRQNFEPLFDVPVTIAQSDRPLGTHLFTAQADMSAPEALRWTVMTLSGSSARAEEAAPTSRRRNNTAAVKAAPQAPAYNRADEALDRLSIPDETMKQLASLMSSGASVIVSDQSLAANTETGRGTDFIVEVK